MNQKSAGCSQTFPERLICFFISRRHWSNCSSVSARLTEERLYLSFSSPSVILLSLTFSLSPVSRPVFYFFSSVLPGLCSVAQFCLRRPGTSPLSTFSLCHFRLSHSLSLSLSLFPLSLATLFLRLSVFNFFSSSIPPLLPRDRKGSHLKIQQGTSCFLSAGASRSKSIFKFQGGYSLER